MILIDTSVWIEFFKRQPSVFSTVTSLLESQSIIAAECVFGELLQGVKDSRERTVVLGYWDNLPKRAEAGIWIEAGLVSAEHKGVSKGVGLIDTFLICFARRHHMKIWTMDKKLMSVLKATENFMPSESRSQLNK